MLKTRKLISMLLVVAMVVSMFAVGIIATQAAGGDYYLTGTIASWGVDETFVMTKTANTDHDEYMVENVTLTDSDMIKAIKSTKGGDAAAEWYPDGMDNNVTLEEAGLQPGVYTVYFRPNGDGDADSWFYCFKAGERENGGGNNHYGYMFYFEKTGEADPQDPSDDPDPYVPGDMITVYFTNTKSWSEVNCYYWINGGEIQWPGEAASFYETNDLGQDVYSASIDSNAVGVIFNGDGSQTVNIESGIVDGAGWYATDEADGEGHWYVEPWAEPDPQDPSDDPQDPSDDPQDPSDDPQDPSDDPQPTDPQPTDPQPTDPQPTDPVSGETSVTIEGTKYTAHVGDTIHYEYYIDLTGIPTAEGGRPGLCTEIEGKLFYDKTKLQLKSDISGEDDYVGILPALNGNGNITVANDEDYIGINSTYKNTAASGGYDFTKGKAVYKFDFEVIADGTSEIVNQIKNLGSGDVKVVYLNEVIEQFPTQTKVTVDCPHTTQPTDPQPTDPQPTDPQPTDPQPTDPQPTDPQPTTGGQSKITVIDVLGNTTETKVVEVGDEITVTAYLSVPDGKRVNSINVWQEFNIGADMVEVLSDVEDTDDNDRLIIAPNLKGGLGNVEGNIVKVNASTAKYKQASQFSKADTGNDETVLLQIKYKVVAAGESTIKTNIITLATITEDDAMANQVMKSEKVGTDELAARTTLDAPEHEQPTDPQPTDPQPTDPNPTDPQPTDPQPTDPNPTEPTPTEPTPTEPLEKGVYVKADGVIYKVEKGDIFTYVYYLNTGEKVCSLDAETFFDTTGLVLKSGTEEDEDLEALFPIIKDSMTLNAKVEGRLKYNYSNEKGKNFNTNDSELIRAQFEVTADEGIYEINTFLHTVAGADEHKYIFKDEVEDELQNADSKLLDKDGNEIEEYTGEVVVDSEYQFVEKIDEWTLGSTGTANFTVKDVKGDDAQTFGKFTNIEIDGTEVEAAKYTAEAGSVKLAISADYMNTLSVGEHTLAVNFSDDEVETRFTVKAAATSASEDTTTASEDTTTASEDATDASEDVTSASEDSTSSATAATSPKSTKDQSKTTPTNSSTVKTGSTEMAIIFLMVLVMAAGVVLYTKKRKFD